MFCSYFNIGGLLKAKMCYFYIYLIVYLCIIYMNKLVIAGASVERASEIVVLSNKNDFDGKPAFKASTLEKKYPKS